MNKSSGPNTTGSIPVDDGAATPRWARKEAIRRHADRFANERRRWIARARFFHESDLAYMRFLVPSGARVLDLGCGNGDLLAALNPSFGVGIDLSPNMVAEARKNHPHLQFLVGDIEAPATIARIPGAPFDIIVLSDTVGMLEDCQATFEALQALCVRDTRIVISYYSYFWEPLLRLAESLGLKMPQAVQNYLPPADIANLLGLAGFDVVKQERRMLVPARLLGVGTLINRFLAPLPILNALCLRTYTVARSLAYAPLDKPSVSVVVPCRNEKENIAPLVRRLPRFADRIEVIFVEGHSRDGTDEEVERVVAAGAPGLVLRGFRQEGVGKGDAVRKGFAMATGEMLMILDADLTVAPEDLPKFYNAIVAGKGNLITGSRMIYPMERQAMRFLNLVANAAFAHLFSWLLNQRVTDTLCGTKVLLKDHYRAIESGRAYFGDLDPFGDFDLLLGASKNHLKIVEIPTRYASRMYGETQIARFAHGWLLLRMALLAFRRIKAF
jgi:SAM-dependent methyltransferase